jgi:hypothetical protein
MQSRGVLKRVQVPAPNSHEIPNLQNINSGMLRGEGHYRSGRIAHNVKLGYLACDAVGYFACRGDYVSAVSDVASAKKRMSWKGKKTTHWTTNSLPMCCITAQVPATSAPGREPDKPGLAYTPPDRKLNKLPAGAQKHKNWIYLSSGG